MRLILLLPVTFAAAVCTMVGQIPGGPPGGRPGEPPGLSLSIHRLSDLEFGTVTAGRERRVPPSSPDAAHFEVQGPRMFDVRIQWDLPPTLGSVPMTFGPNSAAWGTTSSANQQNVFDPKRDLRVRIPPSGSLFLWLGGVARPAAQQPSGYFAETISLTITLEHE